jgi:nicotinamidase-related amidase
LPSFYDPQRAGSLYPPNTAQAIAEGFAAGLPPARAGERRVILLLVDPQVDFIHTDGALAVPGAVEDTRRTVEWIYRHTAELTAIAVSLDSHIPIQIFYPTWWSNGDGAHPAPFTPIRSREVNAGRWKPLFEREWSAEYVHRLEEQAKKELMIWPYHTMVGTPGHAVTPSLYEAVAYHAAARQAQPTVLIKGLIPKSEFYSVLEPEVPVPEDPQGALNRSFLDRLLSYDLIYLAGQAKSHCVLETLTTVMRHHGHEREVVGKIRVLEDCTSSVQHPEIDFETLAREALARFAAQGVKLVRSTDPIG